MSEARTGSTENASNSEHRNLDPLPMNDHAILIRLTYIVAWATAAGFICPDLAKPIDELHWPLSVRAAYAAPELAIGDSQRHTVRSACGAVLDAKGRNVVHPQAGEKAAASRPAHCGTGDGHVQPQSAADPIVTSVPPPATLAFAAGRAQDQAAGSADDADNPVQLASGGAVRVGATLIASGSIIWVLRWSFWGYLLILGLPLWRDVDLLPIVMRDVEDAHVAHTTPSTEAERAVTNVLDGAISSRDELRRRS
jgi:hypothetical protein